MSFSSERAILTEISKIKNNFLDQAKMKIHGPLSHVTQKIRKNSIKKVSGNSDQNWSFLGPNRPISIWCLLDAIWISEGPSFAI